MEKTEQTTQQELQKKGITLTDIITTALQVPGVKLNRTSFLKDTFKDKPESVLEQIINDGPVEAGCTRSELKTIASKLMTERVMVSATASFVAGLPGGLGMAAAIPADLIQFYGTALRMAQELIYLYGEPDIWDGGKIDNSRVVNRLILYCGVMLGAGGAEAAVRAMACALAKKALAKLPKQALTKKLLFRIVRSIARAFSARMTKEVFVKGVAKVIPILGGVISGGLTIATMRPMGQKLLNALDEAHFDYTEEKLQRDWDEVIEVCEKEENSDDAMDEDEYAEEASDIQMAAPAADSSSGSIADEIGKAKALLDDGIISEEEFLKIKSALIAKL